MPVSLPFTSPLVVYQTHVGCFFCFRRIFKTKEEGGAWWRYSADGDWSGKSAGGCLNYDTALYNPQYVLSPTRPCTVFVALRQRQREVRGQGHEIDVTTVGIKIFNNGGKRVKRGAAGEQVAQSGYSEIEAVDCEALLSPQSSFYTLFVSTFDPAVEKGFSIDVYSDAPLDNTEGSKLRLLPAAI